MELVKSITFAEDDLNIAVETFWNVAVKSASSKHMSLMVSSRTRRSTCSQSCKGVPIKICVLMPSHGRSDVATLHLMFVYFASLAMTPAVWIVSSYVGQKHSTCVYATLSSIWDSIAIIIAIDLPTPGNAWTRTFRLLAENECSISYCIFVRRTIPFSSAALTICVGLLGIEFNC